MMTIAQQKSWRERPLLKSSKPLITNLPDELAKAERNQTNVNSSLLGNNAIRGIMTQKTDQLWQEHLLYDGLSTF